MQKLITFCLVCLIHASAYAESQQEIEARLKALEEEISNYKEMLDSTQGQKSELEETLEKNEKNINKLINDIDNIEKEIETSKNKVSSLTREQKELLAEKSEQQYYIEQQVRAAYEIGNQEYLKVLLNQEDPNEIARMLTYYDYFNQARSRQIESYNVTLVELDRVTEALVSETSRLESRRTELETQRTSLAMVQQEKQVTLKALINQISSTGSEISKLEQDRGRLEQLLGRLQESLANLQPPGSTHPFSTMKGKLLMPVAGKISQRFGNQRNQGKLKWHGIFIDAQEGESVYAVHYGRVVFSDWLRGLDYS